MKTLKLKRSYFPHGTFGFFTDENDKILAKSVEPPWLNNAKGKSCVPEGEYLIQPNQSPKFGYTYILENPELNVTRYGDGTGSGRSHILIHKANRARELQGCIAPGMQFGVIGGEWAVLDSTTAFNSLMKLLDDKPAKLIIEKA